MSTMPEDASTKDSRRTSLAGFAADRFAEAMGVPRAELPPIQQSILLYNECYVGYRFQCGEWDALWRADDERLELRDPSMSIIGRFPVGTDGRQQG
jgi:hypothetical protein